MTSNQKLLVLLGFSLACVTVMFLAEPIKQDSTYHLFADSRVIADVPHFFNVVTNVPFVVVGILGLKLSMAPKTNTVIGAALLAYLIFFTGVLLTGFGSSYYHLNPDNLSLLWDRLPLSVLATALFCAVVSDCISKKIALIMLFPLTALALTSVLYWYLSELQGQGDLRPYALTQFLPILLLPLVLWLFDGNRKGCAYVWGVLGVYGLSKVSEALDAEIYGFISFSGHSIKHLLAGYSTYMVYAELNRRLKSFGRQ